VFRIPDIHCDGCVRSLTGAAHQVDAEATIRADLRTKSVTVNTVASAADIAAAFREAGFTVEIA
jgi:copper chaperone